MSIRPNFNIKIESEQKKKKIIFKQNLRTLNATTYIFIIVFYSCYHQVKAFDKDPPDNGGTITYTFVSTPGERSKFSIDSQTGNIYTRYVSVHQDIGKYLGLSILYIDIIL